LHFGRAGAPAEAWRFIAALLSAPGSSLLRPTERHAAVLRQTLLELPDLRGNLMHDLHTAVLMREHGASRICTRDADFHRFPFLSVVDPLR
jgi:predicted nucleic acid-binding protein